MEVALSAMPPNDAIDRLAPVEPAVPPVELPSNPSVSYGQLSPAAGVAGTDDNLDNLDLVADEVHEKLSALSEETSAPASDTASKISEPDTAKAEPESVPPKPQQPAEPEATGEGEIPLLKHKPIRRADDSENDTISIDADGTLRIR